MYKGETEQDEAERFVSESFGDSQPVSEADQVMIQDFKDKQLSL